MSGLAPSAKKKKKNPPANNGKRIPELGDGIWRTNLKQAVTRRPQYNEDRCPGSIFPDTALPVNYALFHASSLF